MHDLGDREGAIESWEELLEINPAAMAGKDQSVDQLVAHYKEGHDKKIEIKGIKAMNGEDQNAARVNFQSI